MRGDLALLGGRLAFVRGPICGSEVHAQIIIPMCTWATCGLSCPGQCVCLLHRAGGGGGWGQVIMWEQLQLFKVGASRDHSTEEGARWVRDVGVVIPRAFLVPGPCG